MSEKSDKLRAMLEKEKERRIKLNNRIAILERRIQEESAAEVADMVRTANVTPEQLAILLRQAATSLPAQPAQLCNTGKQQQQTDAPRRQHIPPDQAHKGFHASSPFVSL